MIHDCKEFQENINKYKLKKDDTILVSGRCNGKSMQDMRKFIEYIILSEEIQKIAPFYMFKPFHNPTAFGQAYIYNEIKNLEWQKFLDDTREKTKQYGIKWV